MSSSQSGLKFIDFYPENGAYRIDQPVKLILEVKSLQPSSANLELLISRGTTQLDRVERNAGLEIGINRVEWIWQPAAQQDGGYGASVKILPAADKPALPDQIETAFDVLADWTKFPRYGFLCDFSPNRNDVADTIQSLAKYHINGLQFYDWQFRHDSLTPTTDEFTDPLGRPLSLNTIRELLQAAHAHGMAAMPYLAVYAASAGFWRSHTDWALYDRAGQLIPFGEDFLGLMNPAHGSAWKRHLLDECSRVLANLPFDGLHVDQYGEPRDVYDQNGQSVDLPLAFAEFVRSAVQEHPGRPVLFNAVSNWPIEVLAAAPTAFNYIEIWPPETAYPDLVRIVRNARMFSGEKPVVIALYIPAARITNIRLANALIHSAGGSRIELGEHERLLSDPYFPKHEPILEDLQVILRRYADFAVRYSDWFGPAIPELSTFAYTVPSGIDVFARKNQQGWAINLVNRVGGQVWRWNEDHAAPRIVENITLEFEISDQIQGVWWATPDAASLQAEPIEFRQVAGKIVLTIPRLQYWDVIFFETR